MQPYFVVRAVVPQSTFGLTVLRALHHGPTGPLSTWRAPWIGEPLLPRAGSWHSPTSVGGRPFCDRLAGLYRHGGPPQATQFVELFPAKAALAATRRGQRLPD
jgi:hypothetical protein